ncbi:MAG: serine hydrolase domain-containing protein [Burkholderiaceae bacterium]
MNALDAAGLNRGAIERLRSAFAGLVERGRLPGAQWLIHRRGTVGCFDSVGRLDPVRGEPMCSDAIFRIYSMTKPIVSVALMLLAEQGRVLLRDPVSRYLPEFTHVRVGVERNGQLELKLPNRPMTVHDLLRHTAGFTYEFLAPSAVRLRYTEAKLFARHRSGATLSAAIAELPLMHEPGSVWDYSRATDVLGHLIEVIGGQSLGEHLRGAIFEPLGMVDTGFAVPLSQHERIAEPFAINPDTGEPVLTFDARVPAALENGGGGLLSTTADYARFLRMLLGGGTLDGQRLLGRKTVEFMTADHLGPLPRSGDVLPPDHGFGLGFAVKTALGEHTEPGSIGSYGWSGAAGTAFFVDPQEALFAMIMVQAPGQFDEVRELFRQLVYAAIDD